VSTNRRVARRLWAFHRPRARRLWGFIESASLSLESAVAFPGVRIAVTGLLPDSDMPRARTQDRARIVKGRPTASESMPHH
jgi:hypothetical protein